MPFDWKSATIRAEMQNLSPRQPAARIGFGPSPPLSQLGSMPLGYVLRLVRTAVVLSPRNECLPIFLPKARETRNDLGRSIPPECTRGRCFAWFCRVLHLQSDFFASH